MAGKVPKAGRIHPKMRSLDYDHNLRCSRNGNGIYKTKWTNKMLLLGRTSVPIRMVSNSHRWQLLASCTRYPGFFVACTGFPLLTLNVHSRESCVTTEEAARTYPRPNCCPDLNSRTTDILNRSGEYQQGDTCSHGKGRGSHEADTWQAQYRHRG